MLHSSSINAINMYDSLYFSSAYSALVPESNTNPPNQGQPLIAIHKTATLLDKNLLEVSQMLILI